MELRKHIGEKLKHHRVFEGACYSKGVYTLIFGNMKKKTSVLVRLNKQMKVFGIYKKYRKNGKKHFEAYLKEVK